MIGRDMRREPEEVLAELIDEAANELISVEECARRVCSSLHSADRCEQRARLDYLFSVLQAKMHLQPFLAVRNALGVLIRVLLIEDQAVFIQKLLSNLNWQELSERQMWSSAIYPELTSYVKQSEWPLEEQTVRMILEHCNPIIHPRTVRDMEALFSTELVIAAQDLHRASFTAMSRFSKKD